MDSIQITYVTPQAEYNITFDKGRVYRNIGEDNEKTGYYYIHKNRSFLFWEGEHPEILINRFDRSDVLKNEKAVLFSKESYNQLYEIFIESVEDRLVCNKSTHNPYDIWVINLEKRADRKIEFLSQLGIQDVFNINFIKAYEHRHGYYGCALSHIALIAYAKHKNLPYIIVLEDDNATQDMDKLNEIIDRLVQRSDWDVFNGAPSFYELVRYNKKPVFTELENDNELVISNWGQTTNFMIYRSSCYDKMLNFTFGPHAHIDVFIPKNFKQVIYNGKYLNKQFPSVSDIWNGPTNLSGLYIAYEKLMNETPVIKIENSEQKE
jgi:Glycosyltransferase family 25 (LPS biosynthesis protein)